MASVYADWATLFVKTGIDEFPILKFFQKDKKAYIPLKFIQKVTGGYLTSKELDFELWKDLEPVDTKRSHGFGDSTRFVEAVTTCNTIRRLVELESPHYRLVTLLQFLHMLVSRCNFRLNIEKMKYLTELNNIKITTMNVNDRLCIDGFIRDGVHVSVSVCRFHTRRDGEDDVLSVTFKNKATIK